jgi:hypothetical protein
MTGHQKQARPASLLYAYDRQLAELQTRFGDRWRLWYVPNVVTNTATWCGHPLPVLHEVSADGLAKAIQEAEDAGGEDEHQPG